MIQKIKDKILNIQNKEPIVSDETNEERLERLMQKLDKMTVLWSVNHKTIFRSFVLGIATALGATVGLAIVLAILGLAIKSAGGLPLVGSWISKLGAYIN